MTSHDERKPSGRSRLPNVSVCLHWVKRTESHSYVNIFIFTTIDKVEFTVVLSTILLPYFSFLTNHVSDKTYYLLVQPIYVVFRLLSWEDVRYLHDLNKNWTILIVIKKDLQRCLYTYTQVGALSHWTWRNTEKCLTPEV